jgi:nicotinamide phosphoribosyltransferase
MVEFFYSTDGYKLDHRRQYPEGTEYVLSNLTARASRIPEVDKAVFKGLRMYLQRHLMDGANETFFNRPIKEVTDDYKEFLDDYLGPNTITVEHVAELHKLGYVPLKFWAVPEGTEVPLRMPMLTLQNTHKDFGWIVNYIEPALSAEVWPVVQSATTALRYRKVLDYYCKRTGGDPSFVDYQAHDFSLRGMFGLEAAELAGLGHLEYFKGSDNLPAIRALRKYYGIKKGNSVPATEHSVMCAGGKETEIETFRRLMKLYPAGILSVVSDTWDFWNVVGNILPQLKGEILARNGKLVIRPDSGDPIKIICGTRPGAGESLEEIGLIQALWNTFGGTVNKAGFKELDIHIGAIYGDSITKERAETICSLLEAMGFASTNIVFGVGSYTYQFVTRDTLGQAIKATWCQIKGAEHLLFKNPKTDDGTKRSAKGRIVLLDRPEGIKMIDELYRDDWAAYQATNLLQPVWQDGGFYR